MRRFLGRRASAGIVAVLTAVVGTASIRAVSEKTPGPLTAGDLRWLQRVTFGLDSVTVARFRQLGREKFLEEQLRAPAADPPEIAAVIANLPIVQRQAIEVIRANRLEQQRINTLPADAQVQARNAFNQAANDALYQVTKRHLLRALKSPAQLREQMTWFWMNHFSVFGGKGNLRWTIADYEETVRAHAFGRFSDLVLATATSPAMLEYLDNAQSSGGRINENYARELMELHTLGVSGGPSGSTYTQQDVQELARVLTGAGLNPADTNPRMPPDREAFYVRRGLFEFNPVRHDFGPKTLLGHSIAGKGLPEIAESVEWLCRQPATARYISTRLATYFIADTPPPALVAKMTRTFEKTGGSIAAVLREMFMDKAATATEKFKDPVQFVVSSVRLAYETKTISNFRPMTGWLQQLGEPLYGRVTPDGYPLTEPAWTSSGQLVRRFEIARALGSGNAGLFNLDDNTPGPSIGFPLLASRFYYEAIEPTLSTRTRDALGRTASQQEWNTILLASPEWMQR